MPSATFTELTEAVTQAEQTLQEARPAPVVVLPIITISRQAGAGGRTVSEFLARELAGIEVQPAGGSWRVYEGELIEHVVRSGGLEPRTARFYREDGPHTLRDSLGSALGLHPPVERMVQDTNRAIRALAKVGGCVLIGRGAHIVTRHLTHAIHVRLVGSFEQRAARAQLRFGTTLEEAEEWVRTEEVARRSYVETWFQEDVDDAAAYDLVLNTDRIAPAQAAVLLREIVRSRLPG